MPKKSSLTGWRQVATIALLPLAVLFVVHEFFTFYHLYSWYFWWLDIPVHVLGGGTVAFGTLLLVGFASQRKQAPKLPIWLMALTVIGVVAFVGIFWEFYEFVYDGIVRTTLQGDVANTLKDLSNDLLGGLLVLEAYVRVSSARIIKSPTKKLAKKLV